jgi:hypothetical protein
MGFTLLLLASVSHSDPQYTQLFVGFNGPSRTTTYYFADALSVRISWLSRALSPEELDTVLSKINFQRQMLLAMTIGQRYTATGSITLTGLTQIGSSVAPNVRVGVNVTDCNEVLRPSFPFVLAALERITIDGMPNYSLQNFPDGCKPPKSGVANDPQR